MLNLLIAFVLSGISFSQASTNYCELAQPGVSDNNGSVCFGSYGVLYYGRIVDYSCYYYLADAKYRIETLPICQVPPPATRNDCRILHPGQVDKNGHYCNRSYGVLYRGYIVDNSCYYKLSDAYY